MASVPPAEAPRGLTEDVMAEIHRQRSPRETPVVEVFGERRAERRTRSKPTAWLGAIAAAAAVLIGVFVFNGLSGSGDGGATSDSGAAGAEVTAPVSGSAAGSSGIVVRSGQDYDEAGIERLAATAASGRLPVPQTSVAASDDAAAATRCLTKGAQLRGDERPIELIQATFHGKPADLGVYRVPGSGGGPDRIVVWVVSSRDCSVLSFTQHLLQG
jgi:hypothetical protein